MTELRFLLKSIHCAPRHAVDGSAPEGVSPHLPKPLSGADILTSDGDLTDLPHFARVAVSRFSKTPNCTSTRPRVADREGVLSALPVSQGPP